MFHFGHFFGGLITTEFPFVILIFLGWFFSKLGAINWEGSVVLSKLSIEVFLPCYIFLHICRSTSVDFIEANASVIVAQVFIMAISFCVAWLYCTLAKVDIRYKWSYIAAATITEVKFLNYLQVNSFCYHMKKDYANTTESSYCTDLIEYNYTHMFFQSFITWYFFYYGMRRDREHWRTIVDVGRDIAKAYETELIIDDSSSDEDSEEEEKIKSYKKRSIEQREEKIRNDMENSRNSYVNNKDINIEMKNKEGENPDDKPFETEVHLIKNADGQVNIESERDYKEKPQEKSYDNLGAKYDNEHRKTHKEMNKEKKRRIREEQREEHDKLKREKQVMYDLYKDNLAVPKENTSLHADSDFFQKVEEYFATHLNKHKSDVKPWWYKLSYVLFGPCQIAMFCGFIGGFITDVREWIFNQKGGQFMFYETINSIGNSHLVIGYLLIGANFHIAKQAEYTFRWRKSDHFWLLLYKCILLPFIGLIYLHIIGDTGGENRISEFNAYIQWLTPSSIDLIMIVQAKENSTKDLCINMAIQWVWLLVVNTFAAFSPALKILGL